MASKGAEKAREDPLTRLTDLEKRVEKLERHLGGESTLRPAKGKKESAKEFLMRKNVSAETHKVLALAYFLENIERVPSFNVQDLENAFRSAREKLPGNMNDAVNKNIARGFLMEAEKKKDSKKAWHLTATGEKYVKDQMN